jgi:hypothetical protein
MESGLVKQVTEAYLVDALSPSEAERRFLEEIRPFMGCEFMVTNINHVKIAELFESNDQLADRWFKCKVAFITLDEKTGAEKRAIQMMMVQAIDLRDAVKRLDKAMEGTLGDYAIASVAETAIMDVYRYKTE